MKKMYLVLIAVVMAAGLSSFTTETKRPFATVYFQDDLSIWRSENLTPCTSGSNPVCEVATSGYGTRRIYQSASTSNPFTKN